MTKNWYVIHTYAGFEGRVKASLMERANQMGLTEKVGQILVPTEDVIEIKDGKRRTSRRKFFPGYVLVELESPVDDNTLQMIKETPKVTGFLGPNGKPQAISDREAARYFGAREQAAAEPKRNIAVDYEIGDSVKVLDGPFASFNGVVEELDFDKNRVKVSVSIFGRATPVELDFEQVERMK